MYAVPSTFQVDVSGWETHDITGDFHSMKTMLPPHCADPLERIEEDHGIVRSSDKQGTFKVANVGRPYSISQCF